MINIVCVKYGQKYRSEHVNNLYKMVEKNLSLPFTFYCFTDDPSGLRSEIQVTQLDKELYLESYWWKLCLFDPKNYRDPNLPTLYFDIDTIIHKSIDHFLDSYQENKLRICYVNSPPKELKKAKHKTKVNSSLMLFNPSFMKFIFDHFIEDPDYYIMEFFGVCRYIWNYFQEHLTFFEYYKDFYSFQNIPQVHRDMKLGKENRIRFLGYSSLHLPHIPICMLNSTSRRGVFEKSYEYFSSYYK